MPALFLGHGSPLNAIEDNEFTQGWKKIKEKIPQKPRAILCISAHWETNGTWVTSMKTPRTLHDFYGFPKDLYEFSYPAHGDPELALNIQQKFTSASIGLNENWGLDHGCWSVIKHLYPEADVPILQMSLDYSKNSKEHFFIAKELSFLREKGILIIGSGNIVHNLQKLKWNSPTEVYDWAYEANNTLKELIVNDNYSSLIEYQKLGKEILYSIPTPEHYLPLLYIMAVKNKQEKLEFFNDKIVLGSLSMTSFIIQ